MSAPELFLHGLLDALDRDHLLRNPRSALRELAQARAQELGVEFLDASSNDYLGLAQGIVSRETLSAAAEIPAGAGASRLVHGTHPLHRELERELADWVRLPEALFFSSGYAANVGLVSALGTPGTLILSDALNHASLIDGCRLSRAEVRVLPHLDLAATERALSESRYAMRWVVTESYFSMDGDGPDLGALRALCTRYQAGLVVDEAHALGVFGPEGAGRCAEAGVVPDALVGALGKSVGVSGAFVAGSDALRTLLWNRARSFVFSTAPSPTLAALALLHVKHTRGADAARENLRTQTAAFRQTLPTLGLQTLPGSFGPIVPLLVGSNEATSQATQELARRGVLAQGIRPPTVPQGTGRLRVTLNAMLTPDRTQRLAESLASTLRAVVSPQPAQTDPVAAPALEPAPPAPDALPAAAASGPTRVVVLGTGTGVGKTWIARALARELALSGRVLALKPVESGVDNLNASDAALLAQAAGHPLPTPFAALNAPVSPHLAARMEGREIDLSALTSWVLGHKQARA